MRNITNSEYTGFFSVHPLNLLGLVQLIIGSKLSCGCLFHTAALNPFINILQFTSCV